MATNIKLRNSLLLAPFFISGLLASDGFGMQPVACTIALQQISFSGDLLNSFEQSSKKIELKNANVRGLVSTAYNLTENSYQAIERVAQALNCTTTAAIERIIVLTLDPSLNLEISGADWQKLLGTDVAIQAPAFVGGPKVTVNVRIKLYPAELLESFASRLGRRMNSAALDSLVRNFFRHVSSTQKKSLSSESSEN